MRKNSDKILPSLKKLLSSSSDVVLLQQALIIAELMQSSASSMILEVTKLTEHGYWRIRIKSFEILFRLKQIDLLSPEKKKKLMTDPIFEVRDTVRLYGVK